MQRLNAWRKELALKPKREEPQALEQTLKRQIAWASGTEYFQNRDPIYHMTESFQNTFDMMAAQKKGQTGLFQTFMEAIGPGLTNSAGKRLELDSEQAQGETQFLEQSSMDNLFEPSPKNTNERFVNRFSQTAFNRGTLAGAVIRGTGQMMLFSCLKRTVGQSQPKNFRQRKLFESSSMQRNVAGHPPDKVIYNKGAVDSAVGLVVDVLRDSRRVVDSFTELLEGENVLPEGSGAETLQKMYPFLTDHRERALLTEYRDRLNTSDPGQREVLTRAIAKLEAVVDKKRQMKFRFMTYLRSLSDSASAALQVFNQEAFLLAVHARLEEYEPTPPPPDDEDEPNDPDERGDAPID